MSLSPFFRSPFTDLTGGLISHQLMDRCMKEESRYMECLEAYGLDRGVKKCEHLFSDFHECQTLTKQFKRFVAMRNERDRQIAEGKLKGDQQYVTPRVDSY
ncbi:NADH dehydrogenase [ubiquinone] iron-sulfur protein 5 [Amyelois transitella]|uniref:NADH dehydrogenase [ubiquinone] iron-sulfur protein 5 n=1 Tax=Amyelois transitella TaxID=680683 RepID=UPI00067BF31A|nr:NADH dehydrogenase [ubiquinone] iron-sulfur protein 5 [Amyelois transitella]